MQYITARMGSEQRQSKVSGRDGGKRTEPTAEAAGEEIEIPTIWQLR